MGYLRQIIVTTQFAKQLLAESAIIEYLFRIVLFNVVGYVLKNFNDYYVKNMSPTKRTFNIKFAVNFFRIQSILITEYTACLSLFGGLLEKDKQLSSSSL